MPNFGKIHPISLEINFEAAGGWDWLDSQPDSVYLLHIFHSHFYFTGTHIKLRPRTLQNFTQKSSLLLQLENWSPDVTSVRVQGWLTAEPVKLKVLIARRCDSHFLQHDFAYSHDSSWICDNLEYWPITMPEIFTAGLLLTRKLLGEIWYNSVKIRNCHGEIYVCHSWKTPQEQVCAFTTGPKLNILKLRWPSPDRMTETSTPALQSCRPHDEFDCSVTYLATLLKKNICNIFIFKQRFLGFRLKWNLEMKFFLNNLKKKTPTKKNPST